MISVIVTTYNQESTIGRTLDSIMMQKCHIPVEIVIGEDCSTDGTLRVCQEYVDKYPERIVLLANNPNKGIVDNYFDCIFAAHGEYIADCAGDDFWVDPLKLEKEVTILEQHPEVGIVHTEWQYYDEETENTTSSPKVLFTENITDGKDMLTAILTQRKRPHIHLCTSLYRKSWIRRAHDENIDIFRNKEYGCEDVQVAFYMAKMGNVAYIPDITLNYSWGGESISNSEDNERLFHFFKRSGQLTYDIAKKEGLLNEEVRLFLQFRIYELMMYSFRSGNEALRQEALNLSIKWQSKWSLRIMIVKFITSNSFTWKMALTIRSILRKKG